MGIIRVKDRSWRVDRQINYTRGFAFQGRDDTEAEMFENIELVRDGTIQSRLGIYQHNTNSIGSGMLCGFGRQSLTGALVDTVLAAKTGTTWYSAIAPLTQKQTWTAVTVTQDPMTDAVVFEATTLLDETPILAYTNVNFTGICYWDGTTAFTIANSPPNCTLLRLSNGRLYASGQPAFPNRVYYSDQGNPTSWPGTNPIAGGGNYFDVLPNRGAVTGLEVNAGLTLCIFTDRSIQGVSGDPAPNGGFSLQPLQDGIGCDSPRALSTLGSLTVFPWRGDLYSFSGSIQNLSEPYRGLTLTGEMNPLYQVGGSGSVPIGNLDGIAVDPVNNELFVTNDGDTLFVFPRTAGVGALPIRTIMGSNTGLHVPEELSVDTVNNEIFVPNFSPPSISVYSRTASGNVAPLRVISGGATTLMGPVSVQVDTVNNEIVVSDSSNFIFVFARTANGNTAPLRTITGGATGLANPFAVRVNTVNNEITVANGLSNSVTVYSRTANGNVAPIRTLSGGATGLNVPTGLAVDTTNNEMFVCNEGSNSVTVYLRTANGNTAPTRTISGGATQIGGPLDLSLDTVNNELFVANFVGQSVTVYPRTANGNVTPTRSITNSSANPASVVLAAATKQSFLCITPYNIWFRPCTNTSTASPPVPTTDMPSMAYCIDRARSGWLSVFRYPQTTGMGSSNPFMATAFAVDDFAMFGGGDGNVYFQTVRTLNQGNMLGSLANPVFTQDDPGVDVTSTYRSRVSEQGNPLLAKQWRQADISASCKPGTGSVSINTFSTLNQPVGNIADPITTFSGLTFPTMCVPQLPGYGTYYFIQTTISGVNLYLRGHSIMYRARFEGAQILL